MRQAQAAEQALRARVAKAMAQSAALTQRGRGTKRFAAVAAIRQAVVASVPRSGVAECWWWRSSHHATPRTGQASRERPARREEERHATGEVRVDAAALEAAGRRCGWRVESPKQPSEPWSLAPAVCAYRRA